MEHQQTDGNVRHYLVEMGVKPEDTKMGNKSRDSRKSADKAAKKRKDGGSKKRKSRKIHQSHDSGIDTTSMNEDIAVPEDRDAGNSLISVPKSCSSETLVHRSTLEIVKSDPLDKTIDMPEPGITKSLLGRFRSLEVEAKEIKAKEFKPTGNASKPPTLHRQKMVPVSKKKSNKRTRESGGKIEVTSLRNGEIILDQEESGLSQLAKTKPSRTAKIDIEDWDDRKEKSILDQKEVASSRLTKSTKPSAVAKKDPDEVNLDRNRHKVILNQKEVALSQLAKSTKQSTIMKKELEIVELDRTDIKSPEEELPKPGSTRSLLGVFQCRQTVNFVTDSDSNSSDCSESTMDDNSQGASFEELPPAGTAKQLRDIFTSSGPREEERILLEKRKDMQPTEFTKAARNRCKSVDNIPKEVEAEISRENERGYSYAGVRASLRSTDSVKSFDQSCDSTLERHYSRELIAELEDIIHHKKGADHTPPESIDLDEELQLTDNTLQDEELSDEASTETDDTECVSEACDDDLTDSDQSDELNDETEPEQAFEEVIVPVKKEKQEYVDPPRKIAIAQNQMTSALAKFMELEVSKPKEVVHTASRVAKKATPTPLGIKR